MEFVELSRALGAEVIGLDAGRPLRDDDAEALRAAYDRHHLLLLRDQRLDGDAQVRFASLFGPIVHEKNGAFGYVSNVRPDGVVREGSLLFHSDFAFAREPLHGISLHAMEVPADGAPTLYANAVRAVTLLPAGLRALLEGSRIRNHFDFALSSERRHRDEELAPDSPRTDHPAIAPHPRTGAPVLLANEMHTARVIDLGLDESDEVLAALFAVMYDPTNVYEHRWTPGDLVIWDNVAVHHGRRTIPLTEPRTLQRVALGNFTADELVPNLAALLAQARA